MPALIADAEQRAAPMAPDEMDSQITVVVAAMGAGVPQGEKTEFMTAAILVLEQFPSALAKEAMQDALTSVDSLRKVLPHVRSYCEDYPERMRRRLDSLIDLQSYAGRQA